MNSILKEDIESFTLPDELIDAIRDSVVLVTGATGLIGSMFVRCIDSLRIGVRFILPVRNSAKAALMYEDMEDLSITMTDLNPEDLLKSDFDCDFIVHCASPTDGTYMSTHPVETFSSAVEYTKVLLEYCRNHPVNGMVYLSSIEYYGQIFNDAPVTEDMMGYIDHSLARNSYALGKQASEFLIFAYADEYGVPAKTARLTQTFGAGISPDDKRVFAQFARSVVAGEKIMLHTQGRSAKPYCYLTDCVSALVYILVKGKNGEAYNVATPSTYVTIRELAELFGTFSDIENPVCTDLSAHHDYAPETRVNMDSSRLIDLGWRPRFPLKYMVRRLIDYLRASNEE
ncbi:MAG: NAD(P)-dependent oxidoreductase [Muribaculaceae bacterium]|nr:NAD(P)-dependent oxidoreductase [Muribaculaceae bacterium]